MPYEKSMWNYKKKKKKKNKKKLKGQEVENK